MKSFVKTPRKAGNIYPMQPIGLYPDLDYYKKGNEDDWQNRLKGNRCKSNSEDYKLVSAPIIGAFKERY